ncbi:MAG: hypothetical protein NTV49_12030 [Kiritimatiellaeota bacterium]|nr:hypothetical protein [Kiritimatiellota bacterium]
MTILNEERRKAADLGTKLVLRLQASITEYDRQIAQLFRRHPDAFIFEGVPGAGPALGPRLLSAFGTDRQQLQEA